MRTMYAAASLGGLLLTSALGPVRLGMGFREVRRALGGPRGAEAPGDGFEVDQYGRGRLEASFLDGTLFLIAVYLGRGVDRVGRLTVVHDLEPAAIASAQAFTAWLDGKRIEYRVSMAYADNVLVDIVGGAQAVFGGGPLESIQARDPAR